MTSSIQMSMMNSHWAGTLFEPVFGRRMPSYSEKMAPARLSQPQCAPSFMGKQCDGEYFSYKAQGKDITAFPAPWSSTESSVVDRRSPMTHLSGIDRLHIYRKDSSSEENHSAHKNSPKKQGFTLYTKSPNLSSPQSSTSVIVRNEQAAGDRVSTDRPVYLTVPPAVYRHGPYCTDLCCVMGHGSPSLSNQVYEHSLKTGEPRDTQQQQQQKRPLHTKGVSLCSPGRTLTVPAVMDQTYSPTKVKEVSHGLQCSPRAYPSLYPSQATYEPVIYHNHSPISKYGQAPQHPAYYYSPTNAEVEKRTESKNTGSKHTQEIPVVLKHPLHPPGDHYMATASLPGFEAMPNPAFLTDFDYSGYFVPTLNLNKSPMHTHLAHPRAVHSDYINTSPKHVHRPIATLPTVHRDKSSPHAEHSSPFAHVEQTSPTTCQGKLAVPTSSPQSLNRYSPPKHSLHLRPPAVRIPGAPPPLVPPAHLGLNIRPSRHHAYHFQPYFRHPHMLPTRSILSNKTNKQRIMYCPPIPVSMENVTNPQPSYIGKGPLKRAMSSSSSTNEDDEVFVVETNHKRQRTEHGNADHNDKERSPPMPVINKVFSLAPYQTYIQLARLRLGALPPRPLPYSLEQAQAQLSNEVVRQQTAVFKDTVTESARVKEALNTNRAKHLDGRTEHAAHREDNNSDPPTVKHEKTASLGQQARSNCIQPTTLPAEVKLKQEGPRLMSKAAPLDLSKERPNEKDAETKNSKKEQDDPTDESSCSELSEYPEQLKIVKKEPEEIDPPDNGHMFEIKKCKPDFEYNVECRPRSECGQKFQREVTPARSPPPAFSTPPHPGGKVSFLNIPPQCLKLSSYNIILPEVNLPRGVQISANKSVPSPTQPTTPSIPLQMPVRKHFFELHQSLVKLISKSVAATSEETLKSWLSQMELNHTASGKNQKVSCLFGRKGREACLNEEMKSSLQQVVQRLNEYSAQERCPFPFVVRTGAIFLPMLVVKEVLFPSVHGALIDQVLQVHRVELRPTTLSEEKTLIQMHKRACSSRLRRLMSLKHLPDVYADVVNLLYYTSVCKQLESPSCEVQSRVQE
uniref:Uncharacterized protein n=1 Tax=Neogobius melanostomus TaxID=47308 RepID=A0A8C6SFQ5_9GOBI